MSVLQDPAWRQTERPDAKPRQCDADEAPCDGCQLPTLLADLHRDARDRLLCWGCWFVTFALQPLPSEAA